MDAEILLITSHPHPPAQIQTTISPQIHKEEKTVWRNTFLFLSHQVNSWPGVEAAVWKPAAVTLRHKQHLLGILQLCKLAARILLCCAVTGQTVHRI